jgi:hypothetical protein
VSEWNWKKVIGFGLLGTFIFWLVAILPVFLFVRFLPDDKIPTLGSAGDMFGASSAFFSGLGFFGVVLVLYFDLRERRRDLDHREEDLTERKHSRTPFLVPSVVEEGALIARATRLSGGYAETTLSLALLVENVSDEPAMNVALTSTSPADSMPGANVELDDTPFGSGDSAKRTAKVRFSCSGGAAEALLKRLADGTSTVIEICLTYDSINGTRWRSQVNYELTGQPADRELFRRIIDNDSEAFVEERPGFSSGDHPFLDFKVVANSWRHAVAED